MPKRTRLAARTILLGSALAVVTITGVAATVAATASSQATSPGMMTTGQATTDADKADQMVVVTTIPAGYRDWKFVSAAHEADDLNDIRVVIANDKAINAYRKGKPFPEGSIVGRVAWKMIPSVENNRIFGKEQSFIPGDAPDWYLQFMEKNSKKYAATGGWGYSNFGKDLRATTDKKTMYSCFACHQAIQNRDYVFTRYSP